ncbi:MAG: UDP-N-acetylenolpyruvoylglucosamine reductase [Phycisphaerae bacterium]|nr:UDP-N-acetylenolpyruvoylglucosamine reductase [Phycisphaerae bacterium]
MTESNRSNLLGDLAVDVEFDAAIGALTWFAIGGRAEMLIRPHDEDALSTLLKRCRQSSIPVRILGGGANLLVDDKGIDGVVIKLDHEFFERRRYNRHGPVERLHAMAGADLFKIVTETARQGLDGFSQMAGIPGTIGGALRMNAGGSYGDIGQCIESVSMLDLAGNRIELSRSELEFSYRKSTIPNGIICSAVIQLEPQDPLVVRNRLREIFNAKSASQPMADNSAGCAFRNPTRSDGSTIEPAGKLIDQAGLKGLSIGGAMVSERHANFISTTPDATARDVMWLMKQVQERVHDHHGISLQPEVVIWSDDPEAPTP